MDYKSLISPEDPFPVDLTSLDDTEVQVLNSRIHRALETEFRAFGTSDPKTECRKEFLTEELDRRDAATMTAATKVVHAVGLRWL
ncbi:hypothetical protein [Arthrobacter sp. TMN-50]